MKILILDYEIPYPLNSGHKMRTWHFIKALASEHEVSFLTYRKANITSEALKALQKYLRNVWFAEKTKKAAGKFSLRIKRIGNLLSGIPWEIDTAYSEGFHHRFLELLRDNQFDAILARYIYTGQYLLKCVKEISGKTIIDLDDLEFKKASRNMDFSGAKGIYDKYRKLFNNYLLAAYYKRVSHLHSGIVCSQDDKDFLRETSYIENIWVVPNTVDVESYHTITPFNKAVQEQKTILFCGNLNYEPNIHGIKWFVDKVFLLIRQRESKVKLHIVGMSKRDDIKSLADNKSIFFFNNPESILPFYDTASLVIVPLFVGGGTRIKALEAFACRRPVVATTIGIEGLGIEGNTHCLIADAPSKFASACIGLLNDFPQAAALTEAGYQFVKKTYDTDITYKVIKELFNNG